MAGTNNKIIVWVFIKVWRNYLIDYFTGHHNKVIKVRGWRSALIDTPSGNRQSVVFCPLWFK